MSGLAIVFSGQGAQYSGMGQSLYAGSEAARAVFDSLETVRPGTRDMCFSGSEEELKQTANTQPCIFAVSLAAAAALADLGIAPRALAGFSLGELTALTFAGAFSYTEGFAHVCKRGELMDMASNAVASTMAAVMKLTAAQVEALAAEHLEVYPVNYNCPGQTVVAGTPESLEPFKAAVKAAGGRAVPLKVGGAFHSPYMAPAAEAFGAYLADKRAGELRYPVYANLSARPYGDDVTGTLREQIISPVRWQETVENMMADGITTFVEVGPGNTLSTLIKKCSAEAVTCNVEDMESLGAAAKELGLC